MNETLRNLAEKLAARPYTVRIIKDESVLDDILYVAMNPELEGCLAQGNTIEEAIEILNEFRVDYIEDLLVHSLPIPEPASTATTTGMIGQQPMLTFTPDNVDTQEGLEVSILPQAQAS